ncbi:hypothetical protein GCM10010112_87060 [Actinoplanes lobatus]|uniref:Histone H3/H4 n=1 Tax=Actinoplanes lobatus TaxID=113568 RepID=A0A7W7HCQ3_9ACTN|nr:hypothetical protein [Actinoplanes lobatus]MBB4747757.1 histone H3/H4 [Actinoplanes lobatus]GGN96113.1 hypothetical protein GCM10010112_87060 [Actinoplanes lobatus]GIE45170.1 hypothetical protein Alo02nite_80680 [Actinoplanes lobatus]
MALTTDIEAAAEAGRAAGAAGETATACPYAAQNTPRERACARAWVRAYLHARPPAAGVVDYDGADEHPVDEPGEQAATIGRHLPGRHNQKTHGNRYNTPGDKSSGFRRVVEHATHAAEHAGRRRTQVRAEPSGHDLAQFAGIPADEVIKGRNLYSGHHHDDRQLRQAAAEFRFDPDAPGALARYLDEHAAAVADNAERKATAPHNARHTRMPKLAASDPAVFGALVAWQDAERRSWLSSAPRTLPATQEDGIRHRQKHEAAEADAKTAEAGLGAAVEQARNDDSHWRRRVLEDDVGDDRFVNALPAVPDESSVRTVFDRLTEPIPRDTPPAVRAAAEAHRTARIEQEVAEALDRWLGDRIDYRFGSRDLDEATPAQREALRLETLRLYEQRDQARERVRAAGMATTSAANAETAAREAEQRADQEEGEQVVAEIRDRLGALPDGDVTARDAGKAMRKELGIPSATALKKAERGSDHQARLRAYAGQSVIREAEEVAQLRTALANNRAQLEQIRQRLARGGLRPGVRAALIRMALRFEALIGNNLASITHHERNLADARDRWFEEV